MTRKIVDCRNFPSQTRCTLTIVGDEDEVVRAAILHGVDVHGHTDTPEFRDQIRRSLKDESAASRRA